MTQPQIPFKLLIDKTNNYIMELNIMKRLYISPSAVFINVETEYIMLNASKELDLDSDRSHDIVWDLNKFSK